MILRCMDGFHFNLHKRIMQWIQKQGREFIKKRTYPFNGTY
jgi:hypothetical protein